MGKRITIIVKRESGEEVICKQVASTHVTRQRQLNAQKKIESVWVSLVLSSQCAPDGRQFKQKVGRPWQPDLVSDQPRTPHQEVGVER